jgi:biotin transport system substrate-specific component
MSNRPLPAIRLMDRFWPTQSRTDTFARTIALVFVGTVILWLAAKTKVPFYPVPATLQTLAIVLIAAFYGPRLAFATLCAYLLEGAAGLPVFTDTPERGIGLAYMVGPTGGYLVGFAMAAFAAGWLAERGWTRTILGSIAVALIAHVVLYAFGFAWLSSLFGAEKAFQIGIVPFVLADLVKSALAGVMIVAVGRQIRG